MYPNRIYRIGLDGFGFLLIYNDELYQKMARGIPRLDESTELKIFLRL